MSMVALCFIVSLCEHGYTQVECYILLGRLHLENTLHCALSVALSFYVSVVAFGYTSLRCFISHSRLHLRMVLHLSLSVTLENVVTFEFFGYTPISQNITRLAATLGCYGAFGTGGYTQEPCFLNFFRVALITLVSFGIGGCTHHYRFIWRGRLHYCFTFPSTIRVTLRSLVHSDMTAALHADISFGIVGYTHFSRFLRPLGLRFREWFHSVRAATLGTFGTFDQSGYT